MATAGADRRQGEAQQALGQAGAAAQHGVNLVGLARLEDPEVEAAGEQFGIAGDDHHAAIVFCLIQRGVEFAQHLDGHDIGFAVVQLDSGDTFCEGIRKKREGLP